MSGINWTDEQVTSYLQLLDAQLAESKGASILDLEFIIRPGRFDEWEYRLYAEREKICLTRAQAILVDDWIHAHKYPQQMNEEIQPDDLVEVTAIGRVESVSRKGVVVRLHGERVPFGSFQVKKRSPDQGERFQKTYTITLVRTTDESVHDFIERCQTTANAVLRLRPTRKESTIFKMLGEEPNHE